MRTLRVNPANLKAEDLAPVLEVLRDGGVIAYPTETVYGLGADMYSKTAVQKIFRLKQRDSSKPISVMIGSKQMTGQLCQKIPKYVEELMRRYWPGPLTLVMRAAANVPEQVLSDGKIGLRMPDHPVTLALMKVWDSPITSTSANVSGRHPLTRAEEVVKTFQFGIELVIDAGENPAQIPSTVIDVSSSRPRILRQGAITQNQIEEVF
ncbi:threonylcarbamoyl-AMP synthase [bacterium]|nr:threonylcarbamoyl-AMP synthase [bacterium]